MEGLPLGSGEDQGVVRVTRVMSIIGVPPERLLKKEEISPGDFPPEINPTVLIEAAIRNLRTGNPEKIRENVTLCKEAMRLAERDRNFLVAGEAAEILGDSLHDCVEPAHFAYQEALNYLGQVTDVNGTAGEQIGKIGEKMKSLKSKGVS